jgi:Domain of unknown function (DUF5911)
MLLEEYGLIGDLESAALVGRNGAIDWLCLPRLDSASCFSALLRDEQHGRWLLAPAGEVRATTRRYRPETLVLETEFETADGAVRVIDFMLRRASGPADRGGGVGPRPDVHGTERAPRLRDDPAVGRARVRRRGRSSSILALDQPRSRGSGRPRREPAPSWRRRGVPSGHIGTGSPAPAADGVTSSRWIGANGTTEKWRQRLDLRGDRRDRDRADRGLPRLVVSPEPCGCFGRGIESGDPAGRRDERRGSRLPCDGGRRSGPRASSWVAARVVANRPAVTPPRVAQARSFVLGASRPGCWCSSSPPTTGSARWSPHQEVSR